MSVVADLELFSDFRTFANAQIVSGDLDPMYWLFKRAFWGLPREVVAWRLVLYNAWYHVGTAELMWTRYPEPGRLDEHESFAKLATGVERRGFRGNLDAIAMVNAVGTLAREAGSFERWIDRFGVGIAGWDRAREEFTRARGNGPWAAYKWADLLKHVYGAPLVAGDLGVGGASKSAGPIPGMVRLTKRSWRECAKDLVLQRRLLDEANAFGINFRGLDELETALCDFNSLAKGHYYVGHDIDVQQSALAGRSAELWAAREVFPDRYRGERGSPPWVGVRKFLSDAYSLRREIVNL